jgi:hypothetical protein
MKGSVRFFAALIFLACLAAANSFASTLLCQSGPVTFTGNLADQSMYTCAIPANAVPTGKAIRVTVTVSSGGEMTSGLILNGTNLTDAEPPAGAQTWDFVIMNTGSTTGSLSGITPGASENTLRPPGFQSLSPATVPWASGWTLELWVFADTGVSRTSGV